MTGPLLRAINEIISRIETLPSSRKNDAAPIFIVGPPRSGTTLLYQTLTEAFDVAYLSNLHAKLWGAPSWIETVFRPIDRRQPSDFQSTFGVTRGLSAPSECGEFWYRFFPRQPHHVTTEDFDGDAAAMLRRAVAKLSRAAKRPLIFKNTVNSMRLGPLAATFPTAVFVVMRRDLVDNAVSIYRSRNSYLGDADRWWSVEPPNLDSLCRRPPHEQVVEQVRSISAVIDDSIRTIGSERFFCVEYEDFCDDVHAFLEQFERFSCDRSIVLRHRTSVPPRFDRQVAQGDVRKLIEEYALNHA